MGAFMKARIVGVAGLVLVLVGCAGPRQQPLVPGADECA